MWACRLPQVGGLMTSDSILAADVSVGAGAVNPQPAASVGL
eukprot:SAG11_NODE_8268_length_1037_cov_1.188699_1_plen_40_part_01